MHTVGGALGTHVAWPNHLVMERSDETPDNKKVSKELFKEDTIKNMSSLPSSLIALYFIMEKTFNEGKAGCVTIDSKLFGMDINVWIVREDVIPFCKMEPITGNCIVTYVCVDYGTKLSREDKGRVLAERLFDTTPNQFVLVPCNVGEHWILTIVQPDNNKVYLMDPLNHRNRDTAWKVQ